MRPSIVLGLLLISSACDGLDLRYQLAYEWIVTADTVRVLAGSHLGLVLKSDIPINASVHDTLKPLIGFTKFSASCSTIRSQSEEEIIKELEILKRGATYNRQLASLSEARAGDVIIVFGYLQQNSLTARVYVNTRSRDFGGNAIQEKTTGILMSNGNVDFTFLADCIEVSFCFDSLGRISSVVALALSS